MKKTWLVGLVGILLIAVVCYFVWPFAFTVVPIKAMEEVKQSEAFDPVTYVDKMWSSKLLPTINEKAVDLPAILNEVKVNDKKIASKDSLIPIAKKYGLITVGEAHVYLVKGTGQVVTVNTTGSVGTVEVLANGYTGPIKITLFVGPRIPSDETSVRDGVGFINFGDFKEQTEYGKVAAEINKRVSSEVLSKLDKASLQGKTVSFYGAFTIRTFNLVDINLSEIKIVPLSITVE